MIKELQKVFGSVIKSLEILYVLEDVKPCARIMVHEDKYQEIKSFLKQHKLFMEKSDFKVVKQDTNQSFYSDTSLKVPLEDDKKGFFFVYVSQDQNLVKNAKEFEAANNHRELGLTLGYPETSCSFFEDKFDATHTDLTLDTFDNSEGVVFPFQTNIAGRHFDISLLSHFPATFTDQPSIELAKKHLTIVEKHAPSLKQVMEGFLKSAVLYTEDSGVFFLQGYKLNENVLTYSKVLTTSMNDLYQLLQGQKKIEIVDKHHIKLEKYELKDGFGFMIFG